MLLLWAGSAGMRPIVPYRRRIINGALTPRAPLATIRARDDQRPQYAGAAPEGKQAMDAVKWRFRAMSRAEENHDPMERELFEGEPINTRLVREAIQNSLDAGASADRKDANAPVRMRFSLAGIHNPLPAERAGRYFDGFPCDTGVV